MSTKIIIITVSIFLMFVVSVSAQNKFKYGGYGDGEHYFRNYSAENYKNGVLMSVIKKHNVVYKFSLTIVKEGQILGQITKDSGEVVLDIQDGAPMSTRSLGGSYLVDVMEEKEKGKVNILLLSSQYYQYLEFAKEYPKEDAPKGDAYINIKNLYDGEKWKLLKNVTFVPKGVDPFNLDNQVQTIKSVNIESPGNIKFTIDENNTHDYSVTGQSFNLNGKFYKRVDYVFERQLESQFIAKLDTMNDDELARQRKIFIEENGQINLFLNDILNSMKNREAAERLRARILKVHAIEK